MKNILLLFVSVFAFSQNPNHQTFLDHNWRLNFVQDGDNTPVYVDENINYPLDFGQFSQLGYVINVCNWHILYFSYVENENKFLKNEAASTLIICNGTYELATFFDDFVSNFHIMQDVNSQFPFILTQLPNNQYGLDIYNPSGRRLNFNSTSLSNQKVEINQIDIYPNPVSDILNISSNLEIKKVEIFQINGQKVFESEPNASIDMSKMVAGVYFLKITDAAGSSSIKKIVKN